MVNVKLYTGKQPDISRMILSARIQKHIYTAFWSSFQAAIKRCPRHLHGRVGMYKPADKTVDRPSRAKIVYSIEY